MSTSPQTLFGLLAEMEAEAAELPPVEAARTRQMTTRICGWAKDSVTYYLEPAHADRDIVRGILAEELLAAIGVNRAESIAAKFCRQAKRWNVGDFGHNFLCASSEIRKAILNTNSEMRKRA